MPNTKRNIHAPETNIKSIGITVVEWRGKKMFYSTRHCYIQIITHKQVPVQYR